MAMLPMTAVIDRRLPGTASGEGCPGERDPSWSARFARATRSAAQPRIETMFEGAYKVRRAVQRDARARLKAYWAAPNERAVDPAAVRGRLGLSRTALEGAAYKHVDAAPHLRRFVTKALAMHLADGVWCRRAELVSRRPWNAAGDASRRTLVRLHAPAGSRSVPHS